MATTVIETEEQLRQLLDADGAGADLGAIILRELTLAILSLGLVGSDAFETDESLRHTLEETWRLTNERVAPRFPWLLALQPRRNARFRRGLADLGVKLEWIVAEAHSAQYMANRGTGRGLSDRHRRSFPGQSAAWRPKGMAGSRRPPKWWSSPR